jgi:hypothetical protein
LDIRLDVSGVDHRSTVGTDGSCASSNQRAAETGLDVRTHHDDGVDEPLTHVVPDRDVKSVWTKLPFLLVDHHPLAGADAREHLSGDLEVVREQRRVPVQVLVVASFARL